MSMNPEQLQMMQQAQGSLQQQGMGDLAQAFQQENEGNQLPPELMAQMQQMSQNPLVPEQQPEPLDALKEVAFLACDVFTEFATNKQLDVPTKAAALSQMSQVIGNVFGQLNQPDPQQDLEFKVAEFQMKAQEKQMDLEMKKEEFEMKRAEAQLKLQAAQAQANVKHVENTMNIQNKQQEHSLAMEQKEKENQMNIIHKENEQKIKLQQQKQAPQPKSSNKQGK